MEFSDIYNRYFQDVFVFMYGLSGDEHIAEEIAQDTFVRAIKAIGTFDGAKDIRAWLFTIARNSYYSYCKKRRRECSLPEKETLGDTGISFVEMIENEEQVAIMHAFIHNMKEPYKEVFTLRVMGELSFKRIGAIFGKSDTWARVTFYRAKSQIVEYMEVENNG